METSDTSLPERKLTPQVHLLTDAALSARRIRGESLEHYVHAVMRTIEDFLAHLPETAGMDFRAALAIRPEGPPLVDIEFRPSLLPPAIVGDIRTASNRCPGRQSGKGPWRCWPSGWSGAGRATCEIRFAICSGPTSALSVRTILPPR